jgi:hypothetical protein
MKCTESNFVDIQISVDTPFRIVLHGLITGDTRFGKKCLKNTTGGAGFQAGYQYQYVGWGETFFYP